MQTPITLNLDGTQAIETSFDGEAGTRITVTVHALVELDPTLEILNPDGSRLAFNDDTLIAIDGLTPTDSALVDLRLPETGLYRLRVNSFNGVSVGEVEVNIVTLSQETIAQTDETTTIQTILLPDAPYRYDFEITAESSVSITVRDISGRLDPVLVLYTPDGTIIAQNDDHQSRSLKLNIFDAWVENISLSPGTYTLEVFEFLGRGGQIQIEITQ